MQLLFPCSHFNGGGTPIFQATTCLCDLSSIAMLLGQWLSIFEGWGSMCNVLGHPYSGWAASAGIFDMHADSTACDWLHTEFGSVQDGICARKSPCALHPVSRKFPQCCLWSSSVCLIDSGSLSSFQGRPSSASSFNAFTRGGCMNTIRGPVLTVDWEKKSPATPVSQSCIRSAPVQIWCSANCATSPSASLWMQLTSAAFSVNVMAEFSLPDSRELGANIILVWLGLCVWCVCVWYMCVCVTVCVWCVCVSLCVWRVCVCVNCIKVSVCDIQSSKLNRIKTQLGLKRTLILTRQYKTGACVVFSKWSQYSF